MVLMKYLLSALATAPLVFADKNCGGDEKIKIKSQADADSYSDCKTLKGDVQISEEVSGSLKLNGVQKIAGSLSSKGAENMTDLIAPELASIGDDFKLESALGLGNLKMGSLTSVGSIKFTALPTLQTLGFSKGVSEASNVEIINTALWTLEGITLESVGRLVVTNNVHLNKINVNELKNATGLINIAGNKKGLEIDFPNLVTGSNMTFYNVSRVSVPSLQNLTGQLGFWGNSFRTFAAPNLTTSSDLTFIGNDELRNISMPALTKVEGGFQITRNDKLSDISFPDLETVTGAIDFSGSFDHVSLPSLKFVKGGFNMQSTGDFSCSNFEDLRGKDVIRGEFTCKSNASNPTTKDGSSGGSGSGSGTSTGSGSSTTSSGAASVDNVANMPGMGMAAVFGALVQYVL